MLVYIIHDQQIQEHGGRHGVRDKASIESALARPRHRWTYDNDADLADLAAAYACGLAINHGFVDGNKRTALLAAYTFLDLNGYELDAPEAEAVVIMRALAMGGVSEAGFADWLRQYM